MIAIPDANATIYITKASLWELTLRMFDQVWVDRAVYGETVEAGKKEGRPDAALLDQIMQKNSSKMRIKSEDPDTFAREKTWFVGPGETSVYVLALDKTDAIPITSDLVAKRKFERRGVLAVRTDEMIFAALETGKLTYDAFLESLSRLREIGGTTSERVALLIEKAGDMK